MGLIDSIKSIFRKATPDEAVVLRQTAQQAKPGDSRVIQWNPEDESARDIVAYKHDITEFSEHSFIVVRESQQAVIFVDGKAAQTCGSGLWPTQSYSKNIAGAAGMMSMFTKGETIYKAEVYFVNKVYLPDLTWGTTSPRFLTDHVVGRSVRMYAHGYFGIHIEPALFDADGIDNAKRFLERYVGTGKMCTKQELEDKLGVFILDHMFAALGTKTKGNENQAPISVLDIASNMLEIDRDIKNSLFEEFKKFGITLDSFNFEALEPDEDDIAKILQTQDQKFSQNQLGYNWDIQQRQLDIMETAAGNTGNSGNLMNAGMGIGMGVGMFGAFANGMNNAAQSMTGGYMNPGMQQGYNPYMQQGYNPYMQQQMQQGYNPYMQQQPMQQGYNPYMQQQPMQQGYNPYMQQQPMQQGYNPNMQQQPMQQGYNPNMQQQPMQQGYMDPNMQQQQPMQQGYMDPNMQQQQMQQPPMQQGYMAPNMQQQQMQQPPMQNAPAPQPDDNKEE